jgi:Zn-dependent M28 family amino/carboxypeptidase
VAALITLAHYFGRLGSNERTLLFIAFSGEELGLLGSQVIASSVLADSIIAVVNIEMIGRGLSRGKKRAYVTGPYFSDLQKILNKKLREISPELFGKKFFYNDPFHDEKLFYRSDNYSFAKRGIPAHTIMASSPEDPYYHSPDDEISTLDIDLMAHLIKAIALSCSGLVSGIDTPSRIKPRLLESR